jgi:hypothetical protein
MGEDTLEVSFTERFEDGGRRRRSPAGAAVHENKNYLKTREIKIRTHMRWEIMYFINHVDLQNT